MRRALGLLLCLWVAVCTASTPMPLLFKQPKAAAPPSTGVKWHPGHYAEEDNIYVQASTTAASVEPYIDAVFAASSTFQGIRIGFYWPALETSQGVYSFTVLDQLRSYMASNHPGKRMGIWILGGDFFHGDCSLIALPTYITTNSSYGTSPNAGSYGYWWIGGVDSSHPGCAIGRWRSAVVTRINALYTAIANHTSPYATGGPYTYDTDPFVEAVNYDESALLFNTSAGAPGDFTQAVGASEWETMQSGIVSAFPHTQVVDWQNFICCVPTDSNAVVNADMSAGLAQGGPDTYFGTANWTYGQSSYAGLTSGSTNWIGTATYIATVQYPDYSSSTIAQIFTTATAASGTGLGGSQIWWGDNFGNLSNIATFINSNPIPSGNTACPSSYTFRGGCNTN